MGEIVSEQRHRSDGYWLMKGALMRDEDPHQRVQLLWGMFAGDDEAEIAGRGPSGVAEEGRMDAGVEQSLA